MLIIPSKRKILSSKKVAFLLFNFIYLIHHKLTQKFWKS